ncbi:amino acid adenylation domain-containing protein [Kitasatospora sp. NPDC057223]|uniref:non-ribosomal peptide synthetase n=1 Tax=Kitasatospora sp. NPDC057223 TaxID=3346055 RepID=UPI0036270CCB
MSDMLKRLARLPEDRRAQLLARLRAEAGGPAGRGPRPRSQAGPAPLSYNQEPMWSYAQLEPDAPTYNMPFCYRIAGPLDAAALARALTTVVARHAALRTTLVDRGDGPVQVVLDEIQVRLPVVDVPDVDVAVELVGQAVRVPLRLGEPPLWRATLYRVAADDHVFLFNVHHAVFDGWSQSVLAADLGACYRAEVLGTGPADLPQLALQYPDFASWQRESLSGDRKEELGGWWRERLAAAPVLEFPTDRPRPAQLTFDGTVAQYTLPPDAVRAADGYAQQVGVTPFAVQLAAFLAVLRHWTRQDELVVGSPNANRTHSSLEPVVGFFINQLVLCTDLTGNPTFADLVERVRTVLREAAVHGELPFGTLVDAVRPRRDRSRQPLFQVAFALQEATSPLQLEGTTIAELEVPTGTSRFDMAWDVRRTDAGADVVVEYRTALFDEPSIGRFAEAFGRALRQLAANPQTQVDDLVVVSDAEREQSAVWAVGPSRPVRETTVAAEFEARVAEAPEAPALVVSGQTLSYAELNQRADRVAHHLVGLGARPGAVVGLSLARGVDLVVSVLGVLKSGAAYLPLDPEHPQARVDQIIADSGAVTVLTEAVLAGLPTGPPVTAPLPAASPSDVAYVLYTSGSTGQPKGVQIEHRSVINFVDNVRDLFELTPADHVLGFAAMTFDVSVFETFSALLTGATLYHATDTERTDIHALQTLIETGGITVTDLPPAVMPLLEPERFPQLRIAFVGGEEFTADLVNRWNPGRRLFNGYGPTECTVTMIVQECAGRWEASPPIGLPMTNHVAHVLDPAGHPVPVGVPGELLIGGTGLARGYLNDPGLTDARFIPDPFGTAPGGRLYHTGDLVKRNPDGTLTFLGRIDHQIKIRGLRIELGDIETAARDHPGLAQIAVNPWTDDHGEHHLVAYLVPTDPATAPDRTALREHLATQLPPYMVPSFFVTIPGLPLTTSGKLNRRALPAPDPHTSDTAPAAARTPTEHALIDDIITPLLHTTAISPQDDFFALGGNSLQASRLISMISRRFGVQIALADFFLSPTPAHLGAIIDVEQARTTADDDLFAELESMSDQEVAAHLEHGEAPGGHR